VKKMNYEPSEEDLLGMDERKLFDDGVADNLAFELLGK
jgi:hypothetical protein